MSIEKTEKKTEAVKEAQHVTETTGAAAYCGPTVKGIAPQVDAIDTVTGKLALVMKCKEAGTPIICSMGAGNKMDPTRFEVTDIYKTSVCPLAKVMRTECRKRRIKHLKVVYSKEPAMTPIEDDAISCKDHCICPPGTQRKCTQRRSVPGSNAFVPSVAGLIIGGEVVKDLVGFVPMKG